MAATAAMTTTDIEHLLEALERALAAIEEAVRMIRVAFGDDVDTEDDR
jgi:hypothetical protein